MTPFTNSYYLKGIFTRLRNEILGEDYTNDGTTSLMQDAIAAEDIIYAYKSLKQERNAFVWMSVVLFIAFIYTIFTI